jgi:tetratricopeptide (TPR) repeat protein
VAAATELLASSQASQGKFDQAIATLQSFPADDPRGAPLQKLLGNIYLSRQDYRSAIEAFERAVASPEAPPAYFHDLVLTYGKAGRLAEARKKALEKLEAYPDPFKLHLLLGMLYDQERDTDSAESHYLQVLQSNPDREAEALAANNLAMIYADRDEMLEEAERLALKATAAASDNPFYRDTLGWVCYRRERYEEARSHFLQALSGLPENAHVNYHLGLLHYQLGELEEAADKLEKARALLEATGHYPNHPYRAEIEKLLGQLQEERQAP